MTTDNAIEGPMKEITYHAVKLGVGNMKEGKAMEPSGSTAEMLTAAGNMGIQWMTKLCNAVVREGKTGVKAADVRHTECLQRKHGGKGSQGECQ